MKIKMLKHILPSFSIFPSVTPIYTYGRFYQFSQQLLDLAVLDLGLISIASLGPRASTKVESHVNFAESQ